MHQRSIAQASFQVNQTEDWATVTWNKAETALIIDIIQKVIAGYFVILCYLWSKRKGAKKQDWNCNSFIKKQSYLEYAPSKLL